MIRTKLLSAIAASGILLSAGALSAQAADYDDSYPTQSRYSHDFADDPTDDTVRPVRRDYDEDAPRDGWRRHWSADRYGHHQYTQRVEARSSYRSDYVPFDEREARARFSAIDAWKAKVSNIYGPRFAHWRNAVGKQVDCNSYRGAFTCTVSARPVPGWSRWSWYGQ